MKEKYTQSEFVELVGNVSERNGWDFSVMKAVRQPVPWDYNSVVKNRLRPTDRVLDIGTGGGEQFLQFAPLIKSGLGIDIDPVMVMVANNNAIHVKNVSFQVGSQRLDTMSGLFDVIINRHAPFDIAAIKQHLLPTGIFITQQVGENNMANVKKALNQETSKPVISKELLEDGGLQCVEFREYNVEYIVKDIESLIFWLNALDLLHADLSGKEVLESVSTLNDVLAGNVTNQGFITNEHRYLAIAKMPY